MAGAAFFFFFPARAPPGGPAGSSVTSAVGSPTMVSTKNGIITIIGGFIFDVAAWNNSSREWAVERKEMWMQKQKGGQAAKRVTRGTAREKARRSAIGFAKIRSGLVRVGDFKLMDTVVELINAIPAKELKAPVALMTASKTTRRKEDGTEDVRVTPEVVTRLSVDDFANRDSKPPFLVVVMWTGKMLEVGHFTLYLYQFRQDGVAVAMYDSFNRMKVDEELAILFLRRYFGKKGTGLSEEVRARNSAILDAVEDHFGQKIPLETVSWSKMAGFRFVQGQGDGVTCGYQTLLSLLLLVTRLPPHVSSAIQGKAFVTPKPLLMLLHSLVVEVSGAAVGPVTTATGTTTTTSTTTSTTSTTTTTATGHDLVTFD